MSRYTLSAEHIDLLRRIEQAGPVGLVLKSEVDEIRARWLANRGFVEEQTLVQLLDAGRSALPPAAEGGT